MPDVNDSDEKDTRSHAPIEGDRPDGAKEYEPAEVGQLMNEKTILDEEMK